MNPLLKAILIGILTIVVIMFVVIAPTVLLSYGHWLIALTIIAIAGGSVLGIYICTWKECLMNE